jgi:hypothetical protein
MAQLDVKGIGSATLAILVGSLFYAGVMLGGLFGGAEILLLGFMLGPLLGGVIAGILTKNGFASVGVGLLSGLLGAFIFITAMLIDLHYNPPEYLRSEVEFAIFGLSVGSVFFGLIFGTIGGVIGAGIRNTVKSKKHYEN